MFDNYIVPVFFVGGALALLGLLLFGWALPSFLKGKWSYLISLLGLGLVAFAYFDGTIVITYKIWLGLLGDWLGLSFQQSQGTPCYDHFLEHHGHCCWYCCYCLHFCLWCY